MEDYKKKYEEAVQRAMDYANGKYPEALVSTKAAVELIFPELKGSEDEKVRKWIIAKLTQSCRNSTGEENIEIVEQYNKAVAWLEKQGEQKPAEWSEEDEYCRHQLIVFCKNCMAQDDDAKKCANWLKSLKPQSHWKPSEEQIEVLQDTILAYNEDSFPTDVRVLSSLCNELKKLME